MANYLDDLYEGGVRNGRDFALADVVEALEQFYQPQLHRVMHPADFVTKHFKLDGHENLEYA